MPNLLGVNPIAIMLCGVASLVLGSIWYSPRVFGRVWQQEAGLSDRDMAAASVTQMHAMTFALSALAAYFFSTLLGAQEALWTAGAMGAAVGLFFVTTSIGIQNVFERKSISYWLINAGYFTILFAMIGVIVTLFAKA